MGYLPNSGPHAGRRGNLTSPGGGGGNGGAGGSGIHSSGVMNMGGTASTDDLGNILLWNGGSGGGADPKMASNNSCGGGIIMVEVSRRLHIWGIAEISADGEPGKEGSYDLNKLTAPPTSTSLTSEPPNPTKSSSFYNFYAKYISNRSDTSPARDPPPRRETEGGGRGSIKESNDEIEEYDQPGGGGAGGIIILDLKDDAYITGNGAIECKGGNGLPNPKDSFSGAVEARGGEAGKKGNGESGVRGMIGHYPTCEAGYWTHQILCKPCPPSPPHSHYIKGEGCQYKCDPGFVVTSDETGREFCEKVLSLTSLIAHLGGPVIFSLCVFATSLLVAAPFVWFYYQFEELERDLNPIYMSRANHHNFKAIRHLRMLGEDSANQDSITWPRLSLLKTELKYHLHRLYLTGFNTFEDPLALRFQDGSEEEGNSLGWLLGPSQPLIFSSRFKTFARTLNEIIALSLWEKVVFNLMAYLYFPLSRWFLSRRRFYRIRKAQAWLHSYDHDFFKSSTQRNMCNSLRFGYSRCSTLAWIDILVFDKVVSESRGLNLGPCLPFVLVCSGSGSYECPFHLEVEDTMVRKAGEIFGRTWGPFLVNLNQYLRTLRLSDIIFISKLLGGEKIIEDNRRRKTNRNPTGLASGGLASGGSGLASGGSGLGSGLGSGILGSGGSGLGSGGLGSSEEKGYLRMARMDIFGEGGGREGNFDESGKFEVYGSMDHSTSGLVCGYRMEARIKGLFSLIGAMHRGNVFLQFAVRTHNIAKDRLISRPVIIVTSKFKAATYQRSNPTEDLTYPMVYPNYAYKPLLRGKSPPSRARKINLKKKRRRAREKRIARKKVLDTKGTSPGDEKIFSVGPEEGVSPPEAKKGTPPESTISEIKEGTLSEAKEGRPEPRKRSQPISVSGRGAFSEPRGDSEPSEGSEANGSPEAKGREGGLDSFSKALNLQRPNRLSNLKESIQPISTEVERKLSEEARNAENSQIQFGGKGRGSRGDMSQQEETEKNMETSDGQKQKEKDTKTHREDHPAVQMPIKISYIPPDPENAEEMFNSQMNEISVEEWKDDNRIMERLLRRHRGLSDASWSSFDVSSLKERRPFRDGSLSSHQHPLRKLPRDGSLSSHQPSHTPLGHSITTSPELSAVESSNFNKAVPHLSNLPQGSLDPDEENVAPSGASFTTYTKESDSGEETEGERKTRLNRERRRRLLLDETAENTSKRPKLDTTRAESIQAKDRKSVASVSASALRSVSLPDMALGVARNTRSIIPQRHNSQEISIQLEERGSRKPCTNLTLKGWMMRNRVAVKEQWAWAMCVLGLAILHIWVDFVMSVVLVEHLDVLFIFVVLIFPLASYISPFIGLSCLLVHSPELGRYFVLFNLLSMSNVTIALAANLTLEEPDILAALMATALLTIKLMLSCAMNQYVAHLEWTKDWKLSHDGSGDFRANSVRFSHHDFGSWPGGDPSGGRYQSFHIFRERSISR
ncbi:hypothetical protein AAMO2058_001467400 [Amorphochlora amoebiformis]